MIIFINILFIYLKSIELFGFKKKTTIILIFTQLENSQFSTNFFDHPKNSWKNTIKKNDILHSYALDQEQEHSQIHRYT